MNWCHVNAKQIYFKLAELPLSTTTCTGDIIKLILDYDNISCRFKCGILPV